MAISKFTKDVAVIQKLSDLPNATDGLTADQLKAKFDEGCRLLKEYLNESLVPAIEARNIPFAGTAEIPVEDIQAAIVEVQAQIKEAATGTIVNGSVTREKLAAALLARVYGGRAWVSVKTPDRGDNVAADFPVGQVWLRPGFTVRNLAGNNWTATGCTVSAEENRVTVTGNQTIASAAVEQQLTGLGLEDDKVYILFDMENADPEITGKTVAVNGGQAQTIGSTVAVEADLMIGGALSVAIAVTWPTTSLARGSFTISKFTVVNVSEILRQNTDAHDMGDWPAYLRALQPLDEYESACEVFAQVRDGDWWPMGFAVTPSDRGGTGHSRYTPGQMLYAGQNGKLHVLDGPPAPDMVLAFREKPVWLAPHELGVLRVATGSYTGSGGARTITLPVTPKFLYVYPDAALDCSDFRDCFQPVDQPACLVNGATVGGNYAFVNSNGGVVAVCATIKLSGSALSFAVIEGYQAAARYLNQSGKTYHWTALY